MKITAKDFHRFVDESGLKDKFFKFVERSRRRAVRLKSKKIKEIEYALNRDGQATIKVTSSGNLEIVGVKYVTIAARRPFDVPANVQSAIDARKVKEMGIT